MSILDSISAHSRCLALLTLGPHAELSPPLLRSPMTSVVVAGSGVLIAMVWRSWGGCRGGIGEQNTKALGTSLLDTSHMAFRKTIHPAAFVALLMTKTCFAILLYT